MPIRVIKQFSLCFGFYLLIVLRMIFSSLPALGFWGGVATLVFGTLFAGIGMVIGDAFCRFARPDAVMASDSIELFRAKLFWRFGPQAIGAFIGHIAFIGFMHNILGYYAA